jgi:hypothetical protein
LHKLSQLANKAKELDFTVTEAELESDGDEDEESEEENEGERDTSLNDAKKPWTEFGLSKSKPIMLL